MYVCVCRAVTLSRIRSLAAAGANTPAALEAACGAGGDCGTCLPEIAGILALDAADSERQSQAA
jgi:bacterioferritin-associated ferredoxin